VTKYLRLADAGWPAGWLDGRPAGWLAGSWLADWAVFKLSNFSFISNRQTFKLFKFPSSQAFQTFKLSNFDPLFQTVKLFKLSNFPMHTFSSFTISNFQTFKV